MLLQKAKPSISASKMSASRMQVRHFWPFNKRHDWCSHLDPQYARYQRQRYINTRAKLLKSMRRRNKWDLGGNTSQYFTPKHIRFASHYYGRGNRARWARENEEDEGRDDHGGHQLTEKEKLWQQQIERMRNRIERDPYEAVFGKRVEPFWEGLMPNWMREELGLEKKGKAPTGESTAKGQTAQSTAESQVAKPASAYAYSSQTSWDSWTNKVRKSEWSSNTGEKHYEYDPISNRMIEVEQQSEQADNKTDVPHIETAKSSQRKAIPIPQFAESAQKLESTSSVTASTTSELDGLTAGTIRASMGKPKTQDQQQIAALLGESAPKKSATSLFDHAETYYMVEQQLQALQTQRDNLAKNKSRGYHPGELGRSYQRLDAEILFLTRKLESLNIEQIEMVASESKHAHALPTTQPKVVFEPLRSAVDRMQSKPALAQLDLDDSAAHESTEPLSTVPKSWTKQADLLQADRVRRTSGKSTVFPPSWTTHAEPANSKTIGTEPSEPSASTKALNAEVAHIVEAMDNHEIVRVTQTGDESTASTKAQLRSIEIKLQSREKELENKVAELNAMQGKHQAKVAALKNELDIAYKQSSRHADEFRDQIKKSEQRHDMTKTLEQKYKAKIASLKEDLDTAFKQSAVQADELRDHVKKAEAQLEARIKADEHMLKITAEQQINAEAAARLAKAEEQLRAMSKAMSEQAAEKHQLEQRAKVAEADKATTKSMHRKLLDERFERYKAVGHAPVSKTVQQPDFHEVKHAYRFKPDDLEKELCGSKPEYDNVKTYRFKSDNLEAELRGKKKQAKSISAELSDVSSMIHSVKHGRRAVNPIDGTTAPATGNYASPTGFVNFDPVIPFKEEESATLGDQSKARVKRQERVFSGTKRVQDRMDRYDYHQFRHSYRRRRARFRRFVKITAIIGGLGATAAYAHGTSMEQQEIRLKASQEVYNKMAEQYAKKGEQGLVQAVQENVQKSGGYFWK